MVMMRCIERRFRRKKYRKQSEDEITQLFTIISTLSCVLTPLVVLVSKTIYCYAQSSSAFFDSIQRNVVSLLEKAGPLSNKYFSSILGAYRNILHRQEFVNPRGISISIRHLQILVSVGLSAEFNISPSFAQS
ncbi:hypothetical protein EDC96DRAFT_563793 [Choanephora cucurbitarum]|nr:hypothetical protein EDC96DRAFT_563793 [Choanephora cucurbitarum]